MTDNQFDDIFKKRLESFDSEVPGDMWQRITDKDRDRKVFFFPRRYMLAALLLLTSLAGVYVYRNVKDNNEPQINNVHDLTASHKKENAIDSFENKQGKLNIQPEKKNEKTEETKKLTDGLIKIKSNHKQLNKTENTGEQISAAESDIAYKEPGVENNTNNNTAAAYSKEENINKQIKPGSTDSTEFSDKDENNPVPEDDFRDKFSIELYVSPDIPFNSIQSDNKSYEQVLKDAGKMRLSYSFGARLDIRINKNLSAKIGVQYSQVNERLSFIDSILSNPNVSYNNKYKSIDIPLVFSYTKKWPGTLRTSVNAGILLNISSKYKGAIPDISGNAVNIETYNVYSRNTGVNFYLGIALSKEINKQTDVFAEPYFRYRAKDITSNFQAFDQKIHSAGISLGLRYRLFKKED